LRGREITLSFPPFTRAVVWLLGINTAVFLGLLGFGTRPVIEWVYLNLGLVPSMTVFHFAIWQIVTYCFIHAGFWHWFGNMLGIWMFGSTFESSWGTRRFLELFFSGVVGAALTTIVLSFAHILIASPYTPTVGASGGVFAILMAFGMVFGENEIMMIPFPFLIKAKYFVLILIVVTVVFAISGGGGTAYLAHLGGLFFGYLYVKFVPKRGLAFGATEHYFSVRNSYYRWKRRRAARKFEVFMRKQNRTVSGTFDENGNYIPPDDVDKKNGGSKSGWVN
jgi:membrane associated rhomboid family serine protease